MKRVRGSQRPSFQNLDGPRHNLVCHMNDGRIFEVLQQRLLSLAILLPWQVLFPATPRAKSPERDHSLVLRCTAWPAPRSRKRRSQRGSPFLQHGLAERVSSRRQTQTGAFPCRLVFMRLCRNDPCNRFAMAEHADALALLDEVENLGRILSELGERDGFHVREAFFKNLLILYVLYVLAHRCAVMNRMPDAAQASGTTT